MLQDTAASVMLWLALRIELYIKTWKWSERDSSKSHRNIALNFTQHLSLHFKQIPQDGLNIRKLKILRQRADATSSMLTSSPLRATPKFSHIVNNSPFSRFEDAPAR